MKLEYKEDHIVNLIFNRLHKEFESFVVNYNMVPERYDIEKSNAMLAQKEERLKIAHGGSIKYVHKKKIKNKVQIT